MLGDSLWALSFSLGAELLASETRLRFQRLGMWKQILKRKNIEARQQICYNPTVPAPSGIAYKTARRPLRHQGLWSACLSSCAERPRCSQELPVQGADGD